MRLQSMPFELSLAACCLSPAPVASASLMNLLIVQRILGLLLMLFSLTMLPPIGVALYFADGNWQPFLDAFLALLALGVLVWWPVRKTVRELRVRDGFLVVALFWVVLGLAGAVPLLLSTSSNMSITDAIFEAVSGFTTTGAIIFPASSRCRRRCCTTAARSNGSAASVSSCWPSHCCRCWASAACSCCARKRPGR